MRKIPVFTALLLSAATMLMPTAANATRWYIDGTFKDVDSSTSYSGPGTSFSGWVDVVSGVMTAVDVTTNYAIGTFHPNFNAITYTGGQYYSGANYAGLVLNNGGNQFQLNFASPFDDQHSQSAFTSGSECQGSSCAVSGGHYRSVYSATAAIPEPGSWAMMAGGLCLIGAALRRRRASIGFV